MCSVRVGVATQRHGGGRCGGHGCGPGALKQPHLRVGIHAFLQRDASLHQHHMFNGGLLAARYQCAPQAPVVRRALRCSHQFEVGRAFVGLDDPAAAEVVGHVAHVVAPRQHHARWRGGCVGVDDPRFGGVEAADGDHHVPARRGVRQADEQRLVGFIKDLHIAGRQGTQAMPVHRPALQRDGVLQDVEKCLAVVGPGQVFQHAGHRVGIVLASAQVAKTQRVDATARSVFGPGQHVAIRADGGGADLEKSLAGGARVLVQQQLFGGLGVGLEGCAALAHEQRVFGARLVFTPQPPAVVVLRHAAVVVLDARAHLCKQLALQRLQRRQHGGGVGVFGFQILNDFRPLGFGVVVAQPVVLIHPVPLRATHGVGHGGCNRR